MSQERDGEIMLHHRFRELLLEGLGDEPDRESELGRLLFEADLLQKDMEALSKERAPLADEVVRLEGIAYAPVPAWVTNFTEHRHEELQQLRKARAKLAVLSEAQNEKVLRQQEIHEILIAMMQA